MIIKPQGRIEVDTLLLIKKRNFLSLLTAQFLEALNINLFKNIFFILVTYSISLRDATVTNANLLLNTAQALLIAPFVIFAVIAGQVADKYDKTIVIRCIKGIEVLLMVGASYALISKNVSIQLIIILLLGIHAAFMGPAKYAILPNLLAKQELLAGNAWIETSTFLAILLGTLLGGVLIQLSNGVFIASFLLIISALCGLISSFFITKTNLSTPSMKINWNIIKLSKEMIQQTKKNTVVFRAILGISWLWFIGATILTQLPNYVKNVLGADSSVVTLFLTEFSLGIGLGSLWCSRLLKGQVHASFVPLASLGITLGFIDLFLASQHPVFINHNLQSLHVFLSFFYSWRIVIDIFLIALCAGLYMVPLYTMLQVYAKESYRARVLACNNFFNALFMVACAVITFLLLRLGITEIQLFLGLAIFNAGVSIYICKLIPDTLIKFFVQWIFITLYRVEVIGIKNLEKLGNRLVVVANHASLLDAALIAVFIPKKFIFAIDTNIAKAWWLQPLLRLVEFYPLDPTNPMAIRSLINLIKEDRNCIIFPEGRITITGALMKVYEGPGLIADKAQAKLLPIRIDGAQYTPFSKLKNKVRIRLFPKIQLTILPVEKIVIPAHIKGKERRKIVGLKLYDIMTNLIQKSSNYDRTLFYSLLLASKLHGTKHPIIEDVLQKPVTYKHLIRSSFIVGKLMAQKTKAKENVGLLLPNMISTVIAFFALQAYGRVPAMLNFSSGPKNIVTACRTAQIKIIYTSSLFIEKANLFEVVSA